MGNIGHTSQHSVQSRGPRSSGLTIVHVVASSCSSLQLQSLLNDRLLPPDTSEDTQIQVTHSCSGNPHIHRKHTHASNTDLQVVACSFFTLKVVHLCDSNATTLKKSFKVELYRSYVALKVENVFWSSFDFILYITKTSRLQAYR